jgi:G3E family GTPase
MHLPAASAHDEVTGQQQLTELAVTKRSDLLPVTVISGFFGAGKSVLASQLLRHSGARRVVVTEQLEFADVIVLNKIDCVSERTARSVETLVKALNSGARVMKGEWGHLPLVGSVKDAAR